MASSGDGSNTVPLVICNTPEEAEEKAKSLCVNHPGKEFIVWGSVKSYQATVTVDNTEHAIPKDADVKILNTR